MVNEQPAFSIIVPVYNGASVIGRCLKSILNQTYKNYEVIVIDDGSKDITAPTCRKLAATDVRIQYHRQTNKGVSATRNQGLTVAQNEFVLFVDADDYLSPDCLTSFKELLREDIDGKTYFFQDFVAEVLDTDGKKHTYKWCNFPYHKSSLAAAFHNLPKLNWIPWGVPFAKLFRLSIIRAYNISFKEAITFKEDSIFIMEYLQYIETIVFDPTTNYHYTIDKSKQSLSTTVASFASESLFFSHFKRLSDYFIQKYQLGFEAKQLLYHTTYTSFFRTINSCLYQYKKPTQWLERVRKIRSLANRENIENLKSAGIIDNKMKQIAFSLLKNRQYYLYDLVNTIRYKYTSL